MENNYRSDGLTAYGNIVPYSSGGSLGGIAPRQATPLTQSISNVEGPQSHCGSFENGLVISARGNSEPNVTLTSAGASATQTPTNVVYTMQTVTHSTRIARA